MTATICGARTVDLGEPTSCILPHGHEGNHEDGAIGWTGDECPIELSGERYTTPRGARALIASLQRQLDALDPDAAVAEAERRMVEARRHADDMARLASMYSRGPGDPLRAAHDDAVTILGVAVSAWRLLVEARDAKGGGA